MHCFPLIPLETNPGYPKRTSMCSSSNSEMNRSSVFLEFVLSTDRFQTIGAATFLPDGSHVLFLKSSECSAKLRVGWGEGGMLRINGEPGHEG